MALVVKNLHCNAGDIREASLILGLGRSPGEGNSSPLQYFCLENSMDRGARWATIHGVAKSRTGLKRLSTAHTQSLGEMSSKPWRRNTRSGERSQR